MRTMRPFQARWLVLQALFLLVPFAARDAAAQQTWQVTLIRVFAEIGGSSETLCTNRSLTFNIPINDTGAQVANACVNGVTATLTVAAQSITLRLTGNGVNFAGCPWNLVSPVTGIGFISGDAVPATQIRGTATTNQGLACAATAGIEGSFQAIRTAGGAPPPPPPAGTNPTVPAFAGTVTITPPGGLPYTLTAANAGTALAPGTWVLTGPGASATLQFANGNLALGPNTGYTVMARRFFLLTPPIVPLQGSFSRITWRCIPGVDPCASIATPNTRLSFNPPINPAFGLDDHRSAFDVRAAGDTTFTLIYSQAGGIGTTSVTVEIGTVHVEDLQGRVALVSAGQTRRVVGAAAAGSALSLNGDHAPDQFLYDPASGRWEMAPGIGLPRVSGTWPIQAWQQDGWTAQPGDFDGDGLTDFFLRSAADSADWAIAVNTGEGGFRSYDNGGYRFGERGAMRTYVLNLNGDRLSDVFWHDPATGTWLIAIKDAVFADTASPTATFEYYQGQWAAGWDPHPLTLNDDDFVDLLLFNPASGDWMWALNNGNNGFTFPAAGRWAGATSVYTGDFNGDGRSDALAYDARAGGWTQAMNSRTGFTTRTGTLAPGLDATVGDLDGDGDADVFVYSAAAGGWAFVISEGNGDTGGRLTAGAVGSWAPRWQVSPADFDADGRLDFFLYLREAGTWIRATNGGSGAFSYQEGSWNPGLIALTTQSLSQGSIPNDAAREPCSVESELRPAPRTAASVWVWFVNASSQARMVQELGAQGQRLEAASVPAGERRRVLTSPRSVWVATDTGGTCQDIYVAGDAAGLIGLPMRAAIGGAAAQSASPLPSAPSPSPSALAITGWGGSVSIQTIGSGYRTTGTLSMTLNQPVTGTFQGRYERSGLGGTATITGGRTVTFNINGDTPRCPDFHNPDRLVLQDSARTVTVYAGITHRGTGCAFD